MLPVIAKAEEKSQPEYFPTAEEIQQITDDTLGWSVKDYKIKILQHEFLLDDYGQRLIDLDRALEFATVAKKKAVELLELTKRMYQWKIARAVGITAGVTFIITTIGVILIRLSIAGKL
jgi:hypothetical protein